MTHGITESANGRIRVVGRVVVFMFSCAIVLAVASPLMPKLPGMWSEFCLGTVASLAAFGLTILFLRWDGLRLNDVGASVDWATPLRLLVGFLIGLILVGLWASISAVGGYVRWERGSEIGFNAPLSAMIAYFALSCREELAFHGYPLRRLLGPLGVWGAQLFVAFVFAVEHRIGRSDWPHAIFGAGVGSLLFGMAAIATRGLAVPIGLHAAWNFGQWTLGLRGQPGIWKAIVEPGQEGRTETTTMIVYVAVMTSATFAFWLWHRRRNSAPHARERFSLD